MKKGEKMKRIGILFAVVLTAKLGTIQYEGHKETWYDLPMQNVIARADKDIGMTDLHWIREDGVHMYGPYIVCAAHPSKIRYTFVQTSLGEGIILDTHTANDTELIDIATTWKE